jgi:CRP-like cAMP-binding protein
MTGYANSLKQVDIFNNLIPAHLDLISNICIDKDYHVEDIVFGEGDNSDELYIILQGEVDIQVNPALVTSLPPEKFSSATIATLRRGQSFGEIALVDHGLRSATARITQNNTHLIIIPRDELIQLCELNPELGYRLMLNLATDLAFKLRTTDLRVREDLIYTNIANQT